MEFKDRLRELRSEKGITQKDLSIYLKMSKNCVCEWENGRAEPSITTLKTLCDYFECSIDYLVGRENDFGVIENSLNISNDEKQLIYSYRKLSKDKQNIVLETTNTLSDDIK